MRDHRYSHLSDAALLHELAARVAQVRVSTATLVALIAEVDARRLYLPAGYSSMHAYCVEKLHLSDDEAYRRIHAARASRQFPLLLSALAEGRLHLTAVCTLAPHLTEENLDELVTAAAHRRKADIEDFLATRFPQAKPASTEPDVVSPQTDLIQQLSPEGAGGFDPRLGPERVGVEPFDGGQSERVRSQDGGSAPGRAGSEDRLAPERVRAENGGHDGRLAPERVGSDGQLAPERVAGARHVALSPAERMIQLAVRKGTYDKLQYARALLSHAVRSGDASDVLDRALDLLIQQIEKRKLGTGTRKSGLRRTHVRSRYVPAQVRRAVWERDQGQCTFVGSNGHRCGSKRFLEFDHVDPFARGGKATVEGMRLRCRAHNQFEAGRAFGVEFMNRKRREARLAAAEARDIKAGRRGVDVKRGGAEASAGAEAWRLEAEQGTDVADEGLVGTSDERSPGRESGDVRAG